MTGGLFVKLGSTAVVSRTKNVLWFNRIGVNFTFLEESKVSVPGQQVAFLPSVSSCESNKQRKEMQGKRLAGFTAVGSCLCLICVLAYAYVLILLAARGPLPRAEVSAHKNNERPSFAKAVMRARFGGDENQGKWPQQRKPFPILCVMALNQPVKETCQEGEIGRWENLRGKLSATLSSRVLSPSSLLFHVSSQHHFSLFTAPRESLSCLPPTQVALTTRGFNGKKRSCLFLST